jgi:hypothetical protein
MFVKDENNAEAAIDENFLLISWSTLTLDKIANSNASIIIRIESMLLDNDAKEFLNSFSHLN